MATMKVHLTQGQTKEIDFPLVIDATVNPKLEQELFQGSFLVVTDSDGVTHAYPATTIQEVEITGD